MCQKPKKPKSKDLEKFEILAFEYLIELHKDPTNGALFYHAKYVNPKWNRNGIAVSIGNHVFYRRIS